MNHTCHDLTDVRKFAATFSSIYSIVASQAVTNIIQILDRDRDVGTSISEHHPSTVFPADPKTRAIPNRKHEEYNHIIRLLCLSTVSHTVIKIHNIVRIIYIITYGSHQARSMCCTKKFYRPPTMLREGNDFSHVCC